MQIQSKETDELLLTEHLPFYLKYLIEGRKSCLTSPKHNDGTFT